MAAVRKKMHFPLKVALPKFILWQIAINKAGILKVNSKILEATDRRNELEQRNLTLEKDKIAHRYAQNDIDRAYTEKQQLVKKMNILLEEYYGKDFVAYQDEVGEQPKERKLVWRMEDHPFRVHLVWVEIVKQ